jgi:hypothetical protein
VAGSIFDNGTIRYQAQIATGNFLATAFDKDDLAYLYDKRLN